MSVRIKMIGNQPMFFTRMALIHNFGGEHYAPNKFKVRDRRSRVLILDGSVAGLCVKRQR